MKTQIATAEAIAMELMTPEADRKIEEAIDCLEGGQDPRLVLRLLYAYAHMSGMIAVAKAGEVPQC